MVKVSLVVILHFLSCFHWEVSCFMHKTARLSHNSIRLFSWERSIADIKDLSIETIEGCGNGVVATTAISPQSIVLSVPSKFALEITNNRQPTPFPQFVSQSLW